MNTSFDQITTANIIPNVAIADAPLPVTIPRTAQPTTSYNPFHPLFLFVPFIFLLAIAALLLSKLLKFGIKQWLTSNRSQPIPKY